MDESDDVRKIREALNRHGVFLKKRVLSELHQINGGLRILGEEIASTFGGTRVADIVTQEEFGTNVDSRLIFECKRVDPDKRWIFFPHTDRQHRKSRAVTIHGSASEFFRPLPRDQVVCSEGFEFPSRSVAADQDPVFKAAAQLAAAFLGFVQSAFYGSKPVNQIFKFAPILVTTAKLFIAKFPWAEVALDTGKVEIGRLELLEVDDLVLKHPFPTPEGMETDFRESVQDPWPQIFTESIYVVRANALKNFLARDKREFIANV